MNDKKIALISCVNDEIEYQESLFYINRLKIPEGFEIDAIRVLEADSMCAGYQWAMQGSDAKYKIYLHQDTFLIYENLLVDMVQCFQKNPALGLLGVIGGEKIPHQGWPVGKYDTGVVMHNSYPSYFQKNLVTKEEGYRKVESLDGLILMTQYDLPWRRDLFHKWDFYDMSACMEFLRAGYEVGIPYQKEVWCFHDNHASMISNYDQEMAVFVKEYQDIYPFVFDGSSDTRNELEMVKKDSVRLMEGFIQAGNQRGLEEVFANEENCGYIHLRDYEILAKINQTEKAGQYEGEPFWNTNSVAELRRKIQDLRHKMKRFQFMQDESFLKDLFQNYSVYAVRVAFLYYELKSEHLWELLNQEWSKWEAIHA